MTTDQEVKRVESSEQRRLGGYLQQYVYNGALQPETWSRGTCNAKGTEWHGQELQKVKRRSSFA